MNFAPRLEDELDDVLERDVLVVRAAIVSPADVIANLFRGHARENVVEDLNSGREVCGRVGKITALDTAVKRHRGVR